MTAPPLTFSRLRACPCWDRAVRRLQKLHLPDRPVFVEPTHSENVEGAITAVA